VHTVAASTNLLTAPPHALGPDVARTGPGAPVAVRPLDHAFHLFGA